MCAVEVSQTEKSRPYFSIVLSVYNIKNYLQRCIDSLKNQKFDDFEVIFVDDGSTDGSEYLCDKFAQQFQYAQVIHKENGGLSSARNAGLQAARGEYMLFLDPDDWIDKELLYEISIISKTNKIDVYKYGYRKMQDGHECGSKVPCFDEGMYKGISVRKLILPKTICNEPLFDYRNIAITSAWASVYRRDFLLENEIEFESERVVLNEDYLFNLLVMLKAESVYVSRKVLYNYDYRVNSLSKRYISNMVDRKSVLFERFKTHLTSAGLFTQFKQYYYGFCLDGLYACITNECSTFASGNKDEAVERVRKILERDDCKIAVRGCAHVKMGLKGKVIYMLMKMRAAKMMVNSYSLIKG